MPESSIWLTIAEVGERYRLSRRTVQSLISDGRLRSVKVGSARRVPISELERFERKLLSEGGQS